MQKTFPILLVLCFSMPCFFIMATSLFSAETAVPAPGKQVVQSVELPASTSVWNWRPDQPRTPGQPGLEAIGEPKPLDESKTDTLHYWLFLPTNYESQAQAGGAPLLLFLHGAGERGNESGEEIAKVKVHGPPRLLDDPVIAKYVPCVVVSPQCKNGFAWSPAQLMLLLDHIEKNYKIDKSRIYITGLSMGGFGTWMCLNESPKRFAAAAPVCGGAKLDWAEKLTDVPIWAFHGDQDSVVTLDRTQNMVDAIRKAGGKKVILTVYEGVGHDSWTQTYNSQMLYDWLFQQSLGSESGENTSSVPMFEIPIGDRNSFKISNVRNGGNEKFSVNIHVSVKKADAGKFQRRYEQCINEIIDRVTVVLVRSTTEERTEAGHTAIKERVQKAINEVLGTPWVQKVFFSEIYHNVQGSTYIPG